jgi:hypothetical protein
MSLNLKFMYSSCKIGKIEKMLIGGMKMEFLIAAAVLVLFAAYMIIKNARGSADRSAGPDINDPRSAPDSIGDKGNADDGDGDAGE